MTPNVIGFILALVGAIGFIIKVRDIFEPEGQTEVGILDFVIVGLFQLLDIINMLIFIPIQAYSGYIPIWLAVASVLLVVNFIYRALQQNKSFELNLTVNPKKFKQGVNFQNDGKDINYYFETAIHLIIEVCVVAFGVLLVVVWVCVWFVKGRPENLAETAIDFPSRPYS